MDDRLTGDEPEEPQGAAKMKILLVLGQEYRTYMEAMADAIQEFRPDVEVIAVGGDTKELEAETERLKPQLVICSPPAPENPVDERLALIELSPDAEEPSSFRVGERHWESANPTLGEILSVVDETKGLFRSIRGPDV
jgi:hypothetical protein